MTKSFNTLAHIFLLYSASSFQAVKAFLPLRASTTVKDKSIENGAVPLHGRHLSNGQSRKALRLDSALSTYGGQTTAIGDLSSLAYEWCTNLGAPAALVAASVISTLYEKFNSNAFETTQSDSYLTMFAKRCQCVLLLSAFGFEIISIFVTTVTGTKLMGLQNNPDSILLDTSMQSGLKFLQKNYEFEYLTSRITFLQGLLNWLASIALDFAIPKKGQGKALRKLNRAIASCLGSTIILILAFYNGHMNFYTNYFHMIQDWVKLTWKQYVTIKRPRPLSLFLLPSVMYSMYLLMIAFISPSDESLEQ